jgi:hypothetical protein
MTSVHSCLPLLSWHSQSRHSAIFLFIPPLLKCLLLHLGRKSFFGLVPVNRSHASMASTFSSLLPPTCEPTQAVKMCTEACNTNMKSRKLDRMSSNEKYHPPCLLRVNQALDLWKSLTFGEELPFVIVDTGEGQKTCPACSNNCCKESPVVTAFLQAYSALRLTIQVAVSPL